MVYSPLVSAAASRPGSIEHCYSLESTLPQTILLVPHGAYRELLLIAATAVPVLAAQVVVIVAANRALRLSPLSVCCQRQVGLWNKEQVNATVCCEYPEGSRRVAAREQSSSIKNIPASFVSSPRRRIRQS